MSVAALEKAIKLTALAGVQMLRKSQMNLFDLKPTTHEETHQRVGHVRHLPSGATVQVAPTQAKVHVTDEHHHVAPQPSDVVETTQGGSAMEPHERHGISKEEFDRIASNIGNHQYHEHGTGMSRGEFKQKVRNNEFPELIQSHLAAEKEKQEAAARTLSDAQAIIAQMTPPAGYTLALEGNEILIRGPYDADLGTRLKRAGGYWDGLHQKNRKLFAVPVEKAKSLARIFGNNEKAKVAQADQKKLAEIKRWLGYVEEKAPTGYLYQKGIDTLKTLGIDQHPEFKVRLDTAINTAKLTGAKAEVNKWLGYIEENIGKYWYSNGETKAAAAIAMLEWMGGDGTPYRAKLDNLRTEYQAKAKEAEKHKPSERKPRDIFPLAAAPPIGKPLRSGGQVIVYESSGQAFKIDEDMPSMYGHKLLGHEGERAAYFYYRPADPEEIAALEAREQVSAKKKEMATKITSLSRHILQTGTRPEHLAKPEGETLLNTFNIYGGGEQWVIQPDKIWYIRNNGMDGDDWSQNNIGTGGAGAIGTYIPYDEETASLLREMASMK